MYDPDPCPSCGAAMAPDQRYCLTCGARRGAPRVAYEELLTTDRPVVGAPPAAPVAAAAPPPVRGPWTLQAALATIACLLLAMAIGVMIGRNGDDGVQQVAAPAPQVVTVGGTGPAEEETTAGGTSDDEAAAGKDAKAEDDKKKGKGKGDAEEQGVEGSQATNTAITELEQLSPEEYQKQSQKLPKELGTGGAPPPKDDKAPAGGGDFEEIG